MREWLFGKIEIVAHVMERIPEIDPEGDHDPDEREHYNGKGEPIMVPTGARVPRCYSVELFAGKKRIAVLAEFGSKKGIKDVCAGHIEQKSREKAWEYLRKLRPIETQR